MDRSQAYLMGFRRASKLAVTLILQRAEQMNDPSARAALNVTADLVGSRMKEMLGETWGPDAAGKDEE